MDVQYTSDRDEKQLLIRKICLILLACVGTVFLLEMLFVVYLLIWPVQAKTDALTLELGDELTEDAGEYLNGTDFSLRFATVDTSGVNPDELGVYTAFCSHGMNLNNLHASS